MFRRIASLVASWFYEGSPASGAGFVLVGEPYFASEPTCSFGKAGCPGDIDGGHMDGCPAWGDNECHDDCPWCAEDDDLDLLVSPFEDEDEDDLPVYTCSGCGAYGGTYEAEHLCWRNPDGSFEVGGQFL